LIEIAGTNNKEINKDAIKVIDTVIGINERYFQSTHGKDKSGINTANVVRVQEISGALNSCKAISEASLGVNHFFTHS